MNSPLRSTRAVFRSSNLLNSNGSPVQTKMVCQSMTVSPHDRLLQDDNALLPVRKRKRKQRRTSENGLPNKWAHMEPVNTGTDNVESTSAVPIVDCKEESSGGTDDNCSPPPLGSGFGKARLSASDQPRDCPLCGLVIRQARNLRRHIETACKYRMRQESQVIELDPGDILADDFDENDNRPSSTDASNCSDMQVLPIHSTPPPSINDSPLESNPENIYNGDISSVAVASSSIS